MTHTRGPPRNPRIVAVLAFAVWRRVQEGAPVQPTMFDALSMALAVYPEAEVSVGQDGLTLFPSPPAIPKAEARRLGII